MNTIKVLHTESHWQCADGCCDNSWTESSFMYNDVIHVFEGPSADHTIAKFLEEVIGVKFEEEYESKDS